MAACAGPTVDALQRHGGKRNAHSEQLADALSLDMTDYWEPTSENHLSRISLAQIIDTVTEAGDKSDSIKLHGMKKADAAKAAERMLKGKSWLPAVLRGAA